MNFKQAIKKMLEDGEFEKIIKKAKGRDKANAKEIYSLIKDNPDLDNIPLIVLLRAIKSYSVLQDAICYMTLNTVSEKLKENKKG